MQQQPPNYTQPDYYQQPNNQQPSYWTGKHVLGVLIILGSIAFAAVSFIGGFLSLGLAWCFIPFLIMFGILGIVLLF